MNERMNIKINRNLMDLLSCDLDQAWELMRNEVEKRLCKGKLICAPYITDSISYNLTSIFVKTNQSGSRGRRYRTYKPLGKIESLLIKEKSDDVWHDISSKASPPDHEHLPQNFSLSLDDTPNQRSITVAANGLFKSSLPKEFSPIRKVTLDKSLSSELANSGNVYLVTEVIAATRMELSITIGRYARVFYIKGPQTVVFGHQKYTLNHNAEIVSKKTTLVKSKRTAWVRLHSKMDITHSEKNDSRTTKEGLPQQTEVNQSQAVEISEQKKIDVSKSEELSMSEEMDVDLSQSEDQNVSQSSLPVYQQDPHVRGTMLTHSHDILESRSQEDRKSKSSKIDESEAMGVQKTLSQQNKNGLQSHASIACLDNQAPEVEGRQSQEGQEYQVQENQIIVQSSQEGISRPIEACGLQETHQYQTRAFEALSLSATSQEGIVDSEADLSDVEIVEHVKEVV